MNFKVILLILSTFSLALTQTIHCNFVPGVLYRCDATIDNPTGFDGDISINGNHVLFRNDDDVLEVRIVGGTTTIIPSAICRRFRNNQLFTVQFAGGIQTLTEDTFRDCHHLWGVDIRFNPVKEIHPQIFMNNIKLGYIIWFDFLVTILPENIFVKLELLEFVMIRNCFSLIDLPKYVFQYNQQINHLDLTWNNLNIWRPEWTRELNNLDFLSLSDNRNIPSMPQNAINAINLREIWINSIQVSELDFFMFNNISMVTIMAVENMGLTAIDFNLIDQATSLDTINLNLNHCIARNFNNFQEYKTAFMAELEPCFAAFDSRILSFTTSSATPFFNSIRRKRIQLQVQTFSDAILIFSANPDGSSPNFEIFLGIDGNTRSCIHENGVRLSCTATPSYLNPDRMVPFSITMSNNWVFVQQETATVILQQLQAPFTARFMGVRTSGHTASWTIQQQ